MTTFFVYSSDRFILSELLASKVLNYFCQDEAEQVRALQTGWKGLYLQKKLWDDALVEIRNIDDSTINSLYKQKD